jgi:hypothetical protein
MLKELCFAFFFLFSTAIVAQDIQNFSVHEFTELECGESEKISSVSNDGEFIKCRESEQYDLIVNIVNEKSKMSDEQVALVTREIIRGWGETGIPPSIILAVIEQESKFNPNAKNRSSIGLGQTIPRYAKPFVHKEDMRGSLINTLKVPHINVRVAIRMMKHMIHCTKSWNDRSYNMMLSAYNRGPSKATRKLIKYSIEVKKRAAKYRILGIV